MAFRSPCETSFLNGNFHCKSSPPRPLYLVVVLFLLLAELKALHALSMCFCPLSPPAFPLDFLHPFLLCSGSLEDDCPTEMLGTVHAWAVVERRTRRSGSSE